MIMIRKGDTTYKVSKGSYEIYFKDQGFKIVEENKEKVVKTEAIPEVIAEVETEIKPKAKNKKVGDK